MHTHCHEWHEYGNKWTSTSMWQVSWSPKIANYNISLRKIKDFDAIKSKMEEKPKPAAKTVEKTRKKCSSCDSSLYTENAHHTWRYADTTEKQMTSRQSARAKRIEAMQSMK